MYKVIATNGPNLSDWFMTEVRDALKETSRVCREKDEIARQK